jgi:hypothetical protein
MTFAFSRHLAATFAVAVACAPIPAFASGCGTECAAESEPALQAPALVPPALLSGPNFKVVPEVEVRGYMARFLIDTP